MTMEDKNSLAAPVYLDNAATTPMDARVIDAMSTVMRDIYANPSSSTHAMGRHARDMVEMARGRVARLIGASAGEIVFTSGATESCNLAIKGVAEMYADRGRHVIVSRAEHKAVIEPCRRLEREGYSVTWLETDQHATVSAGRVADAIRNDTILVCVMAVNNVVGTINPMDEIGQVCKKRGVLFFCDATQAVGKVPVDVEQAGVDLLAMSAHKLYGPKGSGALYVRGRSPRVRLTPLIDGGGQERGLRSGTLNTAGIAGMGLACELAQADLAAESQRLALLRHNFEEGLLARIGGLRVLGRQSPRAPHISSILFGDVDAAILLETTPGLAASTGSACGTNDPSPNHVLRAMGLSEDEARASVRFSMGRFSDQTQLRRGVELICDSFQRLTGKLAAERRCCDGKCCG
ncbi:MAG: cysteine desulfurase [Phycisphaerae bacterium]|nr:cysteine desulfurase [Phycisphaerae bacterium]